jgi:hypothetical protein
MADWRASLETLWPAPSPTQRSQAHQRHAERGQELFEVDQAHLRAARATRSDTAIWGPRKRAERGERGLVAAELLADRRAYRLVDAVRAPDEPAA